MSRLRIFSRFLYRRIYTKGKYIRCIESRWVRLLFCPIFHLFNFFYFQRVLHYYQKHIADSEKERQIFCVGRRDYGTHIYLINYLRLWEHHRGKVALCIFNSEPDRIQALAQIFLKEMPVIYPDHWIDHLMCIIFGHHLVFHHTLLRAYYQIRTQRPDFLHMFELTELPYAQFNAFLENDVQHPLSLKQDPAFIQAYCQVRKQFDYQWNVFTDHSKLQIKTQLPKPTLSIDSLKTQLELKEPFILMNVNVKLYQGVADRRTIHYPDRYNCLIDALIEKGYQVVIQGRDEQPYFTPRKGLIDYSKHPHRSLKHDIALHSECTAVISSKSGVEGYAMMCDAPLLGLNYTEILGMQPAKKHRFYPKTIRETQSGRCLTWQEHLTSPHFFEIGTCTFGEEVKYVDMTEDQMMSALEEFLSLLSAEGWHDYTEHQKTFKSMLTPLHMELFLAPAVPCEAYLSNKQN